MPKISDRPMRRVCVRLWDEDCEALESYATHEKKFNALLRNIVHVFVINAGARLRTKDRTSLRRKTREIHFLLKHI